MLRFALNSIENVDYISIISSDMQNSYYGFCGTFFKSAFGAIKILISLCSDAIIFDLYT